MAIIVDEIVITELAWVLDAKPKAPTASEQNPSRSTYLIVLFAQGKPYRILIDDPETPSLVGSIFVGQVVRVLDQIESLFVDIGQTRTALLNVGNVRRPVASVLITHASKTTLPNKVQLSALNAQWLLVQVIKEARHTSANDPNKKGNELTTTISLSTPSMVYYPFVCDQFLISVSQKLDTKTKAYLTALIDGFESDCHLQSSNGRPITHLTQGRLVLRTQAAKLPTEILLRHYQSICERYHECLAPNLLAMNVGAANDRQGSRFVLKKQNKPRKLIARPLLTHLIEEYVDQDTQIITDQPIFLDHLVGTPMLQCDHSALDKRYQLRQLISERLSRVVTLPSGGSVSIDEVEALTVIDVNSAAHTKDFLSLNMEAALMIARELRLRNISGIIIIDFVNLKTADQKKQLLSTLKQHLKSDYAKTSVLGMTGLGLVEMTRERKGLSLLQSIKIGVNIIK